MFAKGGDAEGDMLFERGAPLFASFADVVAADAFGEGLVFQSAFDGVHFQIEDALRGADVGAGGEKSGQFVACEEGVLEWRSARHVAVVGVRENGADDFLGVALLAKNLGAFGGVLFVRGVGLVGPAFVRAIVQEGREPPELFIGAVLASVGADAGFYG